MTERIHVEREDSDAREFAQHPEPVDAALRHVGRIALIGVGSMGTSIAIAALDAGFHILLLDREEEALSQGERRIRDHCATHVGKGKIPAALAQEHPACFWKGED